MILKQSSDLCEDNPSSDSLPKDLHTGVPQVYIVGNVSLYYFVVVVV